MRNAGRIKLGYIPFPPEEAQNTRALLLAVRRGCDGLLDTTSQE